MNDLCATKATQQTRTSTLRLLVDTMRYLSTGMFALYLTVFPSRFRLGGTDVRYSGSLTRSLCDSACSSFSMRACGTETEQLQITADGNCQKRVTAQSSLLPKCKGKY